MKKRAVIIATMAAAILTAGLLCFGCGSESGIDEESTGENGFPPPQISFSSGDACLAPFRAGDGLTVNISHSGECRYRFDLLDFHTREPFAFLARGNGPFNGGINVNVPEGDYELRVDSACTWSAVIIGDVEQYACPDSEEVGVDT